MNSVLPFLSAPRAPVATESYWQIGCDDGKAGRAPRRPFPNAVLCGNVLERAANQGYMNGHHFGATRRYEPVHDEGSEP